jgi:hypothetical protein
MPLDTRGLRKFDAKKKKNMPQFSPLKFINTISWTFLIIISI